MKRALFAAVLLAASGAGAELPTKQVLTHQVAKDIARAGLAAAPAAIEANGG